MQSDLHELLSSLSLSFPEMEFQCRGTENAKFIYVFSKTRAAEISIDSAGYFFEAWGVADEKSDEPPLISKHVDSLQELEGMLQNWFRNIESL